MTASTSNTAVDLSVPIRCSWRARASSRRPGSTSIASSRRSGVVLGSAVDAADLYFQLSRDESWALEDGIVKEGNASIEQGVGVRALAGEKTGFAYSDEIMLPALEEAARAARAIAASGGPRCRAGLAGRQRPSAVFALDPRVSLRDEDKIAWLERRRSRDAAHGSARQAGHGERARGA